MAHSYEVKALGPFDLIHESQFFGGWLTLSGGTSIVIAMPIEGWHGSAAVVMSQSGDIIHGKVHGDAKIAEKAWRQALASLSLDIDGSKWPDVGMRDHFIGKLQKDYGYLRPVLFYSPYEAAVSLLIGHRISIRQRRVIMQRMSQEYGESFVIDGQTFYAFPDPHKLLTITEFHGLNGEKILRMHGAAQAALDGWLDRDYLRSIPTKAALTKLLSLRGVGDFYSQGILYRGAGIVRETTSDINTRTALKEAYGLSELPDEAQQEAIVKKWEPYPMWCIVLLHTWMRHERGGFISPQSRSNPRKA